VNFTVASRVETPDPVESPPSVGTVGLPSGVTGESEGLGSVAPGGGVDQLLAGVGEPLGSLVQGLEVGDGLGHREDLIPVALDSRDGHSSCRRCGASGNRQVTQHDGRGGHHTDPRHPT